MGYSGNPFFMLLSEHPTIQKRQESFSKTVPAAFCSYAPAHDTESPYFSCASVIMRRICDVSSFLHSIMTLSFSTTR